MAQLGVGCRARLRCAHRQATRALAWRCLCAPLCATLHAQQTYAVASPAWLSKRIHPRRAGHEQVGSTSLTLAGAVMAAVQGGSPLEGLELRSGGQVHRCGLNASRYCNIVPKPGAAGLLQWQRPKQKGAKLWDRRLLTRPGAGEAPACICSIVTPCTTSNCRLGLAASTRDLLAAGSVQRVAQQLATCALEMRRPLVGRPPPCVCCGLHDSRQLHRQLLVKSGPASGCRTNESAAVVKAAHRWSSSQPSI